MEIEIQSGKVLEEEELASRLKKLVDSTLNPALSFEKSEETGHTILNMQSGSVFRAEPEPEPDEEETSFIPGFNAPPKKLRKLVEARGMPWNEDFIGRDVPYWASDERVDGMGDIVRQDWDFTEFEKNSPMPFSHRWGSLPIGRHIEWKVKRRKDDDYSGKALFVRGLFATQEMYQFAEEVFSLVRARILVAGSVGFYSNRVIYVEDEKEREKLGLGPWGLVFEQNHLLEFSPTTLPANDGAVIISEAISKSTGEGIITSPLAIHCLREMKRTELLRSKEPKKEWVEFDGIIRHVGKTLFPKDDWEEKPVEESLLSEAIDHSEIASRNRASVTVGLEIDPTLKELLKGANETILRELNNLEARVDDGFAEIAKELSSIRELLEALKNQQEPIELSSLEEVDETNKHLNRLKELIGSLERIKQPA